MQTWETLIAMANSAVRKYGANATDAEDAVQDGIVALLEKHSSQDKTSLPTASVCRQFGKICRNKFIDSRRKYKRTHLMGCDLGFVESTKQCISDLSTIHHIENFGIENFPTHHQNVLALCLEGCSHSKISKTLGMKLGTVKTIIRRAGLRANANVAVDRD